MIPHMAVQGTGRPVEPFGGLRSRFHDELAAVDAKLAELVHLVCGEVADATEALLRDDRGASVEILARGHLSDPLYEQVAQQVEVLMARQAPMASDLNSNSRPVWRPRSPAGAGSGSRGR